MSHDHMSSSPAVQLLHGRTQVTRRHHVHLPLDAVFGDERVEGVRQHAEEQREDERSGQDPAWVDTLLS